MGGAQRITLGGRPRLRGTTGVEEAPAATVFLFLLPLGLPLPRFAGRLSAASVVPDTSGQIRRRKRIAGDREAGGGKGVSLLTGFVVGVLLLVLELVDGLSLGGFLGLVLGRRGHGGRGTGEGGGKGWDEAGPR